MSNNPVCLKCKNLDADVYGNYCLLAQFRSNGVGYCDIWTSNICMHDSNQTTLLNKFTPIDLEDGVVISLRKNNLELRGKKLELEQTIDKLQEFIYELGKIKK